jgi:SAM-dependent methyltransferase
MNHVEQTVSTYNAIAKGYHEVIATGRDSEAHRQWAEDAVRRFVGLLPGKKVLVAGCGEGRDSRFLSRLGLDVTSFDLSDGMLELAKSLDPDGVYVKLDMRNVGSIGEKFDGLLANGCLYHLRKEELGTFLVQARNLLASGGVLYCTLKLGAGERFVEKPSENYPGGEDEHQRLSGRRFYAYYSLPEMLQLFRDFEILESRNKHIHKEGVVEFFLRNTETRSQHEGSETPR